jgi:DNA-binding transcriptional LysR family regulator
MKIEELRCFLHVATVQNMTVASQDLGLAQSTVSDRIRGLETRFKTHLFERPSTGQGLRVTRLTVAGERMLPYARKIVSLADELSALHAPEKVQPRAARIGVNESVAHLWLGPWLARLREEEPSLAFDLKVGTTDDLDTMMVNGSLDLAICTRAFGDERVHKRRLAALPMAFVGNAARYRRSEYSLQELARDGLITFQPGSQPHRRLLSLLHEEQIATCRVDTVSSVAVMVRLVEDGAGIATLPSMLVSQASKPKLRILPCRAELQVLPFWLSWRSRGDATELPPAVRSLFTFFEQTPGLSLESKGRTHRSRKIKQKRRE